MALTSKMHAAALLLPLWASMACTSVAQENANRAASRPDGQNPAGLAAGRSSYGAHCAMCHGLDGRGGEHAPGIANSPSVRKDPDRALSQIIRTGIPAAGMPSFRSLSDHEIGSLVKYLRSLSGATGVEAVTGDAERGEKLFFGKAQCGDCHMMAGRGGFIGADLSEFAVGHSPREIREAILRPNEKLLPAHEVIRIKTLDGQSLSGLARNEDNFSLQLQGTDGAFHLLMKSEIAKMERTGRSLMPDDYGARLTPTELDDLVSYIARYGRRVEAPPTSSGDRHTGRPQ